MQCFRRVATETLFVVLPFVLSDGSKVVTSLEIGTLNVVLRYGREATGETDISKDAFCSH